MKRNNKRTWVKSLICFVLVFAMCAPQLVQQTGIVLAADVQETGGATEFSPEANGQESQAAGAEGSESKAAEPQNIGLPTEGAGAEMDQNEGAGTETDQTGNVGTETNQPGSAGTEMKQPEGAGSEMNQTEAAETEDEQLENAQTGTDKGQSGESERETRPESEEQDQTEAVQKRDAVDWTLDIDNVLLNIEKVSYMAGEQEKTALNDGGNIDMSEAVAGEITHILLDLSFEFINLTEEKGLVRGDSLSFNLPSDVWAPDEEASGEVKLCSRDIYRAGDTEDEGNQAVGTYAVQGSTVKVTFNEKSEDIQGQAVFGVIRTGVQLKAEGLQNIPEGISKINLQNKTDICVLLPVSQEAAEEETSAETEDVKDKAIHLEKRSVNFTADMGQGLSVADPDVTTKTFKKPAEGISRVKITLAGKKDGYQKGDDLTASFGMDITLDDEYLYLQHSAHESDTGYPVFSGNMADYDAYNDQVDSFLEGLPEEELPRVTYTFLLGKDFVLPGNAEQQSVDLIYDTDRGPERLGCLTIAKQDDGSWTAVVVFDNKVYNRESVTAGKTVDLQVAEDALADGEPVFTGWEGNLPKVGTRGSLTPDEPDGPSAPDYSVTKEAAASTDAPYIDYVIEANANKTGQTLSEMILEDVIPLDMEVISVKRDGTELTKGNKFSGTTYRIADGKLLYQFPGAVEGQAPVVSARFEIRMALTQDAYKSAGAGISKNIENTAYLRQKDGQTEAAHSDKVPTSINIQRLQKDGHREGLNGLRYSWTLDVNTKFSELTGAYIADTICWDDHMYDASAGIQVYNENGRLMSVLPINERDGSGPGYSELTKDNISAVANGETTPFYYTYEEGGKTYAALIIPYGEELQNQRLKLKYYTNVNIGGMSVEEWQDQNSGGAITLTNDAKFLWNRYIYGNGPGWDDFSYEVDIKKDVTETISLGTKAAGSYDEAARLMRWTFTVNGYGADMSGLTIEDTLNPGSYELNDQDSVKVTYKKYDRDSGTSKLLIMSKDSTGQEPYYGLDPASGKMAIYMGDIDKTEYFEIFLDVRVMDPSIMSNQGDAAGTLSNTAVIKANVNGNNKENDLTADKTIPNTLIKKETVGSYDYSSREITWRTTADMNHTPVTGMVLTDTLPVGSSFSELSKVILVREDGSTEEGIITMSPTGITGGCTVAFGSELKITLAITEGADPSNKYRQDAAVFRFTDGSSAEKEYTHSFILEYKTKFTDENYLKETFRANTKIEAVNNVRLEGNVRGTAVMAGAAADAVLYIKNNKISKEGSYNKEEGLIHWAIKVNESKTNLAGMKIVDEIGSQPLEIDDESVDISEINSDGSAVLLNSSRKGSTASAFGSELVVSADNISYQIPDGYGNKTLLLEFDTALTENAEKGQISNQARLMDKDTEYQSSDMSDGGYTGDFDMDEYVKSAKKPVFQIFKTSANDDTATGKLPLAGAGFTLEAYTASGDGYSRNGAYDKSAKTGTDGKITFVNLKWDTVYRLVENQAPAGYQSDAEEKYYIFKEGSQTGDILKLNVDSQDQDVTCMSQGAAVENTEFSEAHLVIHDTPALDLKIEFKKKYPDGSYANAGEAEFELKDKKGCLKSFKANTDINGGVSFSNVDPGEYTLTELKSADPYDQGAVFNVILNADKTFTIKHSSGNASVVSGTSGIEVVNEYARGKILLKKTDSQQGHQIPLEGAVYTLYDTAGDTVKDSSGNPVTAKSGKDGVISFVVPYSPAGYILRETTPPDGYELPTNGMQEVTVTKEQMDTALNNAASQDGKAKSFIIDLSSADMESSWQKNIRTTGSVSFTKKADSETGEALAGRQFKLLYNDSDGYKGWTKGSEAVGAETTDGNGVVTFHDVPYGNYRLVEVMSPGDIYQPFEKNYELRGLMQQSLEDNRKSGSAAGSENTFAVNVSEPVINTLIKGEFSLKKTDESTKEALEDVSFVLSGKNAYGDDISVTGTNSAGGNIRFKNIPVGYSDGGVIQPYLLEETPPDGYRVPASYHIYVVSSDKGAGGTVDNQADIRIVPLDTEGKELTSEEVTVTAGTPYEITNTPVTGNLTFKKVSAEETSKGLEGAVYKLYRMIGGARATEEQIGKNNRLAPVEAVSDVNGIVTFNDIEFGNYELAETAAPDGYQLDTVPLSVTKMALNSMLAPDKMSFDGSLGDISDEPTALSIMKKDQFGQAVTGAKLKLAGNFADETLTREGLIWEADGLPKDISSSLIVDEIYTLTEEETPPGGLYREIEPVKFKVGADGTIEVIQGETGEYSYESGVLTLKDYYYLAQVKLVKTDSESGRGIPGVTFSLYKQAAESPDSDADILIADALVTDSEGVWESAAASGVMNPVTKGALSEGLCCGKYYFTETASDEAHKLDPAPHVFEITEKTFAGVTEGVAAKAEVNVTNDPIVIKLRKNDSTDGSMLAGAEFILTDLDSGQVLGTVTTDQERPVAIPGVVSGKTYRLEETKAPAGYVLEDIHPAVEFTVEADGKASFTDLDEVTGAGTDEISFSNNTIKAKILKLSPESEELSGWEFSVSGIFAGEQGRAEAEESTLAVTEKEPGILNGRLIAGNSYTVREVKAPVGYICPGNVYTVTVNSNGALAFEQDQDGSASIDNSQAGTDGVLLCITDQQTRFYLDKVSNETELGGGQSEGQGADAERIAGATLEIRDMDGNPLDPAVSWTSDGLAAGAITGLPAGKYQLAEIKTPYGYCTAGTVEFWLKEDNSLEILSGPAKATVEADGCQTVTVTDEVIRGHVQLIKERQETDGQTREPLEGAVFDLYRQTGNIPDMQADTLICSGLKTDAAGNWSTEGNADARSDNGRELSEGLKAGVYYFAETDTKDDTWLDPQNCIYSFEIAEKDHGKTVQVNAVNNAYVSHVSLRKADSTDNSPLEGVEFTLFYDNGGQWERAEARKTDESGAVAFDLYRKGGYSLMETKTIYGYQTDDSAPYTARFTADDSCYGMTLTLQEVIGAEELAAFSPVQENAVFAGGNIGNIRDTGTLELTKTDGADDKLLNGVEFTIYRKGEEEEHDAVGTFVTGKSYGYDGSRFTGAEYEDGRLRVCGLEWGDYYIQESRTLAGYELNPQKLYFTIGRLNNEIILSADQGKVINEKTKIFFYKYGRMMEDCADAGLEGVPQADYAEAMAGAGFTLYRDEECTDAIAEAVSGSDGLVEFTGMEEGTYYIKETKAPEGYLADETVYTAVLDGNGTYKGLFTLSGKEITDIAVVNDVVRTDIILKKVSEQDMGHVLPGSEYGLYKKTALIPGQKLRMYSPEAYDAGVEKADGEEWTLIARAVTDQNGAITFKGVLMDTEYLVRELKAPDGSHVSEKPVTIQFTADEHGQIKISKIDDGDKTAVVDPDTGEIIWREPPIMLGFWKRDTEGNALAGAKLQLQDMDGNIIDEWVSSDTDRHVIYGDKMEGKILAGHTYKLIEAEAPAGYLTAEPVVFTVESALTGPDQNVVQEIVMTDEKEPSKEPDTEAPDTEAPMEMPETEAPDTETPDTETPDTETPTTEVPTETPVTEAPDTETPDTGEKETKPQESETSSPESETQGLKQTEPQTTGTKPAAGQNGSGSDNTAAKTGDNTPVMWYLSVLAAAGALTILLVYRRKRRRRTD